MPLPRPTDDETEDEFIDRCMADETMVDDFPDESQRRAVCQTQWEGGAEATAFSAAPGERITVGGFRYKDWGADDEETAMASHEIKFPKGARWIGGKDIHPDLSDAKCGVTFDDGEAIPGERVTVTPVERTFPHVRQALYAMPWALLPETLSAIVEVVEFRAAGGRLDDEQIRARVEAAERPPARANGAVAVLPLFGVIAQRMNLFMDFSGGTSTERFAAVFRQVAADPNVKAIVIEVDSPGGGVFGVEELAAEIFEARKHKHIVAVANSVAFSAAYWIASAADELVVTPSGQVGSIGVFAAHQEFSKMQEQLGIKTTLISAGEHKVDGHESIPLSDEAQEAIQALVDNYYGMFIKAVARHRGVSVSDVRSGFGQGRMVNAKEALKLGMVDRIATMDETLARLVGRSPSADAQRGLGASVEVAGEELLRDAFQRWAAKNIDGAKTMTLIEQLEAAEYQLAGLPVDDPGLLVLANLRKEIEAELPDDPDGPVDVGAESPFKSTPGEQHLVIEEGYLELAEPQPDHVSVDDLEFRRRRQRQRARGLAPV